MSKYKWSRTASTNATADATIDWAEGMSPSGVNNSGRAMMAAASKERDDHSGMINTGGAADAYTLTSYQGLNPLTDGFRISFNCHATSTGASTINVDSLGAKPLRVATGTALGAGALLSGSVYSATYKSSNDEWLLHGTTLADLGVSTAKIAADAVTYAKIQNVSATSRVLGRKTSGAGDTEELTFSEVLDFVTSAAQGDILYRGASAWERLGAGTSGYFLKTLGAAANPAWSKSGEIVLQTVDSTPYTTSTSLSTAIPSDDTIPTITEGTEILTATMAPSSASNKIRLTLNGFGYPSGSGSTLIVAIFRDSTCVNVRRIGSNSITDQIDTVYIDSPATTSSTVYSVRVGSAVGSVVYMNGTSGGRLFGGAASCNLRVDELQAP